MRVRSALVWGLAMMVTVLAVVLPGPASAAPAAPARAACQHPCDGPAAVVTRPGAPAPAAPAAPRSCIQNAWCGGGAALGLTAGLGLVGLLAAGVVLERPREHLLRRRIRGRDRPPAGVSLALLRPPQFA